MCTVLKPISFDDLEDVERILNENADEYLYVVDLSAMSVVNSTFISTLFRFPDHIAIMNVSAKVLTQLNILGVSKYIKIVKTPLEMYDLVG